LLSKANFNGFERLKVSTTTNLLTNITETELLRFKAQATRSLIALKLHPTITTTWKFKRLRRLKGFRRFRRRLFKRLPKRFKRSGLLLTTRLKEVLTTKTRLSLTGGNYNNKTFDALLQGSRNSFSVNPIFNLKFVKKLTLNANYRMYPIELDDFLKTSILHIGRYDLPLKKTTVYLGSQINQNNSLPSLVSALGTDRGRESIVEVINARLQGTNSKTTVPFFE